MATRTEYYVVSMWNLDDVEPLLDEAAQDIAEDYGGRVVREFVIPPGADERDPRRWAVVLAYETAVADGAGAA